jgi:hypothetical protein
MKYFSNRRLSSRFNQWSDKFNLEKLKIKQFYLMILAIKSELLKRSFRAILKNA